MEKLTIQKPWGKEELLEKNAHYMFKRLTMHKGHACSLQYHEFKTESVYLLSGKLKVSFGEKEDDSVLMAPHDFMTIEPFKVHRMEAIEDSVYLESSTPEIDDVIRIQDRYNRT